MCRKMYLIVRVSGDAFIECVVCNRFECLKLILLISVYNFFSLPLDYAIKNFPIGYLRLKGTWIIDARGNHNKLCNGETDSFCKSWAIDLLTTQLNLFNELNKLMYDFYLHFVLY